MYINLLCIQKYLFLFMTFRFSFGFIQSQFISSFPRRPYFYFVNLIMFKMPHEVVNKGIRIYSIFFTKNNIRPYLKAIIIYYKMTFKNYKKKLFHV